jgi:hypothetical protein
VVRVGAGMYVTQGGTSFHFSQGLLGYSLKRYPRCHIGGRAAQDSSAVLPARTVVGEGPSWRTAANHGYGVSRKPAAGRFRYAYEHQQTGLYVSAPIMAIVWPWSDRVVFNISGELSYRYDDALRLKGVSM